MNVKVEHLPDGTYRVTVSDGEHTEVGDLPDLQAVHELLEIMGL